MPGCPPASTALGQSPDFNAKVRAYINPPRLIEFPANCPTASAAATPDKPCTINTDHGSRAPIPGQHIERHFSIHVSR